MKHVKKMRKNQHVINCKILNENNENIENIENVPEYEEIYHGNTKMKLKIAFF